jgi:catechol 2,3-dioxygenase-like lactoylglutathione lyase family enzyme
MISYEGIHHVSLSVKNTERSKKFYTEILGLKEIERPPLPFPGAWFAVGDQGQQIHVIENPGEKHERELNTRDNHFALRVKSYNGTVEWLKKCGVQYYARPNSIAGFPQIYVQDPDYNIIELNCESL